MNSLHPGICLLNSPEQNVVVCDANIIIDFSLTGESLLLYLSELFDEVYVPYMVIYEITNISEQELIDAGIKLLETPIEMSPIKGLSTEDWSCVLAVQETHGSCITNDKKLRSVIKAKGNNVLWGLETILKMYQKKLITKTKAKKYGLQICQRNKYLTDAVRNDFLEKFSI